jgi:hypothetical protein
VLAENLSDDQKMLGRHAVLNISCAYKDATNEVQKKKKKKKTLIIMLRTTNGNCLGTDVPWGNPCSKKQSDSWQKPSWNKVPELNLWMS